MIFRRGSAAVPAPNPSRDNYGRSEGEEIAPTITEPAL
jgi:hypothetical protein